MSQPSPSWLDNTLRNLTLFVKRTDFPNSSLMNSTQTKMASTQSSGNAFTSFKRKLKHNLSGKKNTDSETVVDESMPEVAFPAYYYGKLTGSTTAVYAEDYKRLELILKP